LKTAELTVRKEVSQIELKELQSAIKPYLVVRVRARLAENSVFGSPQALLVNFVGKDTSDSELNAYAIKLQEPVTIKDPLFGLFKLDRRVNWYESNPDWCGRTIRLTVPALEAEASLNVARQLWSDQNGWHQKVFDCAVKELLKLKNDSWLNENEPELTKSEFIRRMALESISVAADGSFDFWHNDGDLFWGHSIRVSGNLTEGPTHAGIEG